MEKSMENLFAKKLDLKKVISNFKVLSYKQSYKVLIDNLENKGSKNILYVIAGPNGSGKSTLIANIFSLGFLKNVKYVNADIYAKTLFNKIQSDAVKSKKAMNYTTSLLEDNIHTHNSIIYETVLSHESKIDLIKAYKKNNYKIVSIFICPNMATINCERVLQRVKEGGHNVPSDKIYARFERSNLFKHKLKELSDEYYEIDSSNEKLKIIDSHLEKSIY